jgi:hypothetical protein
VFTGQSVHAVVPLIVLYLPATHPVHGPPLGPVKPGLQVQAVTAWLASGEVEPAGQSVHAAEPVVDLYLPAAHCVHEVVPVYPAAQFTAHATLHEPAIPEPRTE